MTTAHLRNRKCDSVGAWLYKRREQCASINNKRKRRGKFRKKESMVHIFLYHTVSLLNSAFLKQNLVTKDGDFQVQNSIGQRPLRLCYLFYLNTVFI